MQIRPMKLSEAEIVLELWNSACIEAVGQPLSENDVNRILESI